MSFVVDTAVLSIDKFLQPSMFQELTILTIDNSTINLYECQDWSVF